MEINQNLLTFRNYCFKKNQKDKIFYKTASNQDPVGADTFADKVKQGMESIEGKREEKMSSVLSVVDEIKEKLIADADQKWKSPRLQKKSLVWNRKRLSKNQPLINRSTHSTPWITWIEIKKCKRETGTRLKRSKSSPKLSSTGLTNHWSEENWHFWQKQNDNHYHQTGKWTSKSVLSYFQLES